MLPSGLTVADPFDGPDVTVTDVSSSVPSESESFARTSTSMSSPQTPAALSSRATGGSLTSFTVMSTVAVSQSPARSQTS